MKTTFLTHPLKMRFSSIFLDGYLIRFDNIQPYRVFQNKHPGKGWTRSGRG